MVSGQGQARTLHTSQSEASDKVGKITQQVGEIPQLATNNLSTTVPKRVHTCGQCEQTPALWDALNRITELENKLETAYDAIAYMVTKAEATLIGDRISTTDKGANCETEIAESTGA